MVIYKELVFILGGRNSSGREIPIDILNLKNLSWHKLTGINFFRHTSWTNTGLLYCYGGFENSKPDVPVGKLIQFNIMDALEGIPDLKKQIAEQQKDNKEANIQGLQESIINKYDLNPNVVVARIEPQNINKALHYYPLNALQREGEKINIQTGYENPKTNNFIDTLCKAILKNLLKPKDFKFSEDFPITPHMIIALCEQVIKVLQKKPTVVKIKPPVKIFGSIHGQINDLLRFFDKYGIPDKHAGFGTSDIEAVGYVFLGNYVDRGTRSLEVICLLLALFLKHPHEIVLLRGAHEDKYINIGEGLANECENRLKENIRKSKSVFSKLNEVFEYLPLACLINEKVLCVPSGIGEHVVSIDQINKIKKPIKIDHSVQKPTTLQKIVFDLLWSDPVQDLDEEMNTVNEQRSHIAKGTLVRFGVNRIKSFMLQNNLDILIRSHEPVREGVEKFGETNLYSVFSCSDYGGTHNNDAACLHFKKHSNQLKTLTIKPENGATSWFSLNNLKKSFINRSMFLGENEKEDIELVAPRQTVTPLRTFNQKSK